MRYNKFASNMVLIVQWKLKNKEKITMKEMSLLHAVVLGLTMIDAENAQQNAAKCPECQLPTINGRCHKCDQAGI